MRLLLLAALLIFTGSALADPAAVAKQTRSWRTNHEREILAEFADLLSIPNLATDTPNIQRNAETIRAMCEKGGLVAKLLTLEGAPPVVVAELAAPNAKRTIAFYAHYDGQPVDASQWKSEPWKPVMRDSAGNDVDWRNAKAVDPEWRLFARSAGDDKVSIIAMLAALDAMRELKLKPAVNLRFFFEGEKEALAKIPDVEADLRREFQIGATEGESKSLNELIMLPALNLRGIEAGHVGDQAANQIPTEARASIDFRLVPDETPDSIKPLVEQHIAEQGYTIVHDAPDGPARQANPKIVKLDWEAGYPASRTPLDLPLSRELVQIMTKAGHEPVLLPTSGGSLPIHHFEAAV